MGEIKQLTSEGDTKVSWNANNEIEVKSAKEIFDKRIKEGWSAFAETKIGSKGDRIKTFDPHVQRIVLVPPISGG